jgi:hypothetical protein
MKAVDVIARNSVFFCADKLVVFGVPAEMRRLGGSEITPK